YGTNGLMTPVNQRVTPAGTQVVLPGVRPNALALSPDNQILVTAGLTHELIVIDPGTGRILQHVALPSDRALEPAPVAPEILNPDAKAQLSFTGLAFSPDGTRIYLANVNGDVKVFGVNQKHEVLPLFSIALPPANAPRRAGDIPAGIAVSSDGKKLYVVGNLSNRLMEFEAATGKLLQTWDAGVEPFDVVLAGKKIYVSNWGGRRPVAESVTGPAGRGTVVRVDDRSIANEGSVTVIDVAAGILPAVEPGFQPGGKGANTGRTIEYLKTRPGRRMPPSAAGETTVTTILAGLHASAMALSPNGRYLVVANTGSDTLSVIDTRTDTTIETIWMRQNPGDLFGAQPTALAFNGSGKWLFVCNGTQNAVAVVQFDPGKSQLLGLMPAGWFPGGIAFDNTRKQVCVANLKDLPTAPMRAKLGSGPGFNSRQFSGSLSLVTVPSRKELEKMTQTALANLRYPLLAQAKLPARPGQAPSPVPERVGEPSVFQHVVYIIKENRTYDQVLGDIAGGNGNADLCIFGERVTPNEHKLVREFTLLDNTYCSGILSADGHQWADSAIATDYVEREFAGWPRSYPCGGGEDERDAMAYSPAGFIWNDTVAHGKTIVNFGEFTAPKNHWKDPSRRDRLNFEASYNDFVSDAQAIEYDCEPDIEALRPYLVKNWPSWDLNVPDVVRAKLFVEKWKAYEAADNLPNLVILWLPNDHTSGTKSGSPRPEAQVADNDLAMGQVMEAVSHSKYWTNTCIFAVEDDPQNGWDHVSGYRTTAYVASAYTKRHAVVHTQYNQTSLLRTMELMLGLPPMNQMDATATPMFDCFTNVPDFTAFDAVTNNVPLNEMNGAAKNIEDAQLRKDAMASAKLPLERADQCPEDVLNRILWRAMKGPSVPYPEWAVKVVDDD
ncbi:MAG TPA: bifunctional YncE family protein/alkaline phosphatase family protein, partial [Desulfuromonadaceae bacterium]|nr:bifunctional YncE family protein/alkaline phosphatase family protein [Desulfuromonadaceae bacterium]